MHVCSGDLWAGAEVAVAGLLSALKLHYDVSALLFNEGIMAQKLRNEGIEVFVVQEHGYKENVLGILAGKLAGVERFVCTQHGASEPLGASADFKNEVNLLLDRAARKHSAHKTISVSEDLRTSLVRQYGSDKVVTIHNGILCKEMPRRNENVKKLELGIPLDKRIVGTMGRLKPVKDIHHFLEAARTILEARVDVVFLVVGEGPLEHELRETAREFRIDDRVYFLGFREDAIEILSTMDVFVLTSLHEGIPLSLLEAMCLGVPVVATKVGGIPEVIEDGCSGLLVELGDEKATAAAILAMLSPKAKGMVREAKRRVLQEFSVERMASRTEQVYRELLANV